jgi:hypothetical protein
MRGRHARRYATCLTAAAASFIAAACVPPPLTAPDSVPGLAVRGTTLMMVGGRGRLTAWPAEDQAREVPAVWTTDSDVFSIAGDGGVTARRLGKTMVHARYHDRTGDAVVHVVASVAGTWQGTVTFVDCWEPGANGANPCRDQRPATAPLLLSVSQSAAAELGNISGVLTVFSPPATGKFVGLFDSDGVFFVQGVVERQQESVHGGVSLRWLLDGNALVPGDGPDIMPDTLLTVTGSSDSGALLFTEIWKAGRLTR